MENEKSSSGDTGLAEDLVTAISNLVNAESHSFGSFFMNEQKKWLEVKNIIRDIRSYWLDKVVKKENSQVYCISKHILTSMIALQEVGNRLENLGEQKDAEKAFHDAGILYGLFLVLNDLQGKGGEADVSRNTTTAKKTK